MLEKTFIRWMKREGYVAKKPKLTDYEMIVHYAGKDRFIPIEDVYGVTEDDFFAWLKHIKKCWDKGETSGPRPKYHKEMLKSTRFGAGIKRRSGNLVA